MFAKYGVTLACILALQIKRARESCVSVHVSHLHILHLCMYACVRARACVSRCELYLVQGAFLHSDVSQQDD